MTKKDLLERIEALESRVWNLENPWLQRMIPNVEFEYSYYPYYTGVAQTVGGCKDEPK